MKNRLLLVIGVVVAVVVGGAIAWYLVSPLFIDRTVDETFPFEMPSQEDLTQMSEAELEKMNVEFMTAIPSEDEMAQMSERERKAVESKVMESAASMPEKVMDEPMPGGDQPVVVSQGQFQDADR